MTPPPGPKAKKIAGEEPKSIWDFNDAEWEEWVKDSEAEVAKRIADRVAAGEASQKVNAEKARAKFIKKKKGGY